VLCCERVNKYGAHKKYCAIYYYFVFAHLWPAEGKKNRGDVAAEEGNPEKNGTKEKTTKEKKKKTKKTNEFRDTTHLSLKKKERRSAIPKRSIDNNDGVFFHVRVPVTDDRVVWHAKIPDRASTSTARWWCLEKTTSGVVLGRIVVVVVVMEKRKNAFFVLVVVCVVLVNATMDEKKFCGCEQQL
tara:strand:+ start:79 stop:633 length:555 start_codon:yes stop_codon:yes gene_type:complete